MVILYNLIMAPSELLGASHAACRSNGWNLQIVQKYEQTSWEFYLKPTIDRLSEEKAQKHT